MPSLPLTTTYIPRPDSQQQRQQYPKLPLTTTYVPRTESQPQQPQLQPPQLHPKLAVSLTATPIASYAALNQKPVPILPPMLPLIPPAEQAQSQALRPFSQKKGSPPSRSLNNAARADSYR